MISEMELNLESFLDGIFPRIDWHKALQESIEERNLRLESEWIKQRMTRLDFINNNEDK